MWELIFDMMKLDTYHHFISDGAEGKHPKWLRVVRFIFGLIAGAFAIGFGVFLFWLAFMLIISGFVALGGAAALAAIVYVVYSIIYIVRGTGKLDGFMRDVMDFKYRK